MGVKAVYFDGSVVLQNNSIGTFPPYSNNFFVSYWYKASPKFGLFHHIISSADFSTNDIFRGAGMGISHQGDPGNVGLYVSVEVFFFSTDGISRASPTFTPDFNIPYDGNWHHLMINISSLVDSITLDIYGRAVITSTGSFALDGSVFALPLAPNSNIIGGTNLIPVPLGARWTSADTWSLGGTVPEPFPLTYVGDLAELFFLVGTEVDITDPDVRARFIDPDTLRPVPIDAGGLYPFFDSLGVVPQIWLSGNQDLFPRNYPGWSATCVSQTDSDPTSQFEVIGNLTTADSDPFGQNSAGV